MLSSESEKRSNERLKSLHSRKKKYERLRSKPIKQKEPDGWDSIQQERYKTLVENVPCAVYSAYPGKSGPTTFILDRWKDWTGYSPEELYQDPEAWPKCIHPDDREKAVDAYSMACRDNVPYNLEYRIVHKETGQVRYVKDQGFLSKDERGDVVRVDGIITDISGCKRAQETIREGEVQFRNFLDNLGDVAYEADASGNVTYANKMAEKITGMPLGDIIGKPFLPFFKKESQQIAIDVYERALNGESTEYELTFTNGRICHFKNKPLRDENGKIIGVFGIARDITERKEVDKALRESEERFRNLFNNALVGLYRTTPDGRILMANPALVRMLGYDSFEELANRNLEEEGFEPGYFRSDFKKRVDASGIVIGLEADWVRRDGTILSVRESAKAIRDELGNVLYYEGTVEDITERKQAEKELKRHRDHLEEMVVTRTRELEQNNETLQTEIAERERTEEALRQSENRYRTVIENAGVGIVVVQDRMLCFVNPQHTTVTGRSQEESMSRPFMEFIHPDDRERVAEVHAARLRGEQVPSVYEFRIIDKNGRTRWLENNGILIEWDGKPASLHFLGDITARKDAEEALRERDEMIRALVETSRDWIWSIDLNGVHTYCNPAVEQVLGYSPDELVGKRSFDLIHDDDRKTIEANLPTWITEKRGWSNLMLRWQHKDGTYRYLESNAVPILNPENELVGFRGVDRDITDRKRAEKALRETTNLLETIFEHTHMLVACLDPQFNFVRVNRAYAEADDREPSFFPGRNHFDLYPNEENEAIFRRVIETDIPYFTYARPFEYAEHPERGISYWDWSLVPIKNQRGIVSGLILTLADVTARKHTEEALRESEEKFRSLAEQSPNMIFINKKGKVVYANKKCEEVMGYKREELCSPDFDFRTLIAPESQGLIRDHFVRHQKGEEVGPYDYCLINKNGDRIEAINASKLIQYEGQTAILGVVTDITDHKKAEKALRESEQKYSSFVRNFMGIAYRGNIGTWTPLFFHGAVEAITGYREGEFLAGKPRWDEVIHPDDLCWMTVGSNSEKIRSEPNFSFKREYRIIRKDGQMRWVLEMLRNLTDESGKPSIVEGCIYDITERKNAEQALRESEERLKILFESAPDAIYLIDSEGRFVDGNRAVVKLIGFPKDEVLGKTLAETGLLSGEQLSKAEANLKKVVTGKLSGPNEYVLKRKDGTHVSIEVRTFPVKIEGKMLTLGIARDITEHKRTEKELLEHQAKLKSLASQLSLTEERERHRLATDLHDQISQSLVISKIKLDQLRKSSSSGEFNEPLKDISNCLGQIIDDTRVLTFDLSYPILYELGFEAAVAEWLADQIQEKHGIKTEFLDDGSQKPLDDDIRVLLFRNVRELLINVVKHAQANKVRVSIRKHKDNICVSIEDDGVGFDPVEATSLAIKRAELGLFSVRERLEQLGGMIKIESEKGRGSRIIMTAPLKYNNSTDRTQDEY